MSETIGQNTPPHSGAAVDVVSVLLVDDDPTYATLCKRYLAKDTHQQYAVHTATDCKAALLACESKDFDCILVDYELPDGHGSNLIGSLHSTPDFLTPTIMLTAFGGEMAAAEAVRAGASDFLPKRLVSAQSLLRAIRNAVEKCRLRRILHAHTTQLASANAQLQSRNEQIQSFYHNVSHEVKTPLAAAREFIAITLDGIAGPVTSEQKQVLGYALNSCDQIANHFNDLIEVARLEAGKIRLDIRQHSLDAVIVRCLAAIADAARDKDIVVTHQITASSSSWPMDGDRIIQVLSNLAGNSIKFTEAGGTIQILVGMTREQEHLEISITDSGCGIDAQHLPYVFDRLYQAQDSGDDLMGAGLGLGLSIAKEIIQLHGGEIQADSTPGIGSTFTVRLPCRQLINNE